MQRINDNSETGPYALVASSFTDIGKFFAGGGVKFKTLLSLTLLAVLATVPMAQAQFISIANANASEHLRGIDFTVSVNPAANETIFLDLSYDVAGQNQPVDFDNDLSTAAGSERPSLLAIPSGVSEFTFTVYTVNDYILENNETFRIRIMGNGLPDGVTIRDGIAIGTIIDEDMGRLYIVPDVTQPPGPSNQTVEGGEIGYTIELRDSKSPTRTIVNEANEAITITWTATGVDNNSSAIVEDDLDKQTGMVNIGVGEVDADFTIGTKDDTLTEGDEQFLVTLTSVSVAPPLRSRVLIQTNNSRNISRSTIIDNDDASSDDASSFLTIFYDLLLDYQESDNGD